MKDILLYGGIGLVAYVLYEMFYGTAVASPSPTTGSAVVTPPSNNPQPGGSTVQPPVTGITASALVAAAGGGNPMLTPQQWNYFEAQLTGKPTSFYHAIASSNVQIDVNTYLARMATAGLGAMSVQGMTRW